MTADGQKPNPLESDSSKFDNISLDPRILEVIQIRLVKWVLLGGFTYLLWGLTNDWPKEIIITPILLPLLLLFSQRRYISHRYAETIADETPVWDFLVASLILTVGIASGKLLLLSAGWVAIGISYFKPTHPETNWKEWFKTPLIWLFVFPFWLDFSNDVTDLIKFLVYSPLGSHGVENVSSLDYTRFHFTVIASLLIMSKGLKGGHFWKLLPILPVVIFMYSGLNKSFPRFELEIGLFQSILVWTMLPITIFILVIIFNKTKNFLNFTESDKHKDFLEKHKASSFFLWFSFLVIASQQYNLIRDNYFVENTQKVSHLALAIWLFGLFWLRFQTKSSHVDTRTKIVTALSLSVLVAAEWTDINFLRHISLGMGFVAITSWRRVWPTSLQVLLLGIWILIIPVGQTATTVALMKGFGNEIILLLAIIAYIIAISLFQIRRKQQVQLLNSGDYEWIPSMRFSFLIMVLLISFQFLSTIDDKSKNPPPTLPITDSLTRLNKSSQFGLSTNNFSGLRLSRMYEYTTGENTKITLLSGIPVRQPFKVPSVLLILKELGWKAKNRSLVTSHPMGSAMEVDLQPVGSNSENITAKALFWWSNGFKAFYSHKRAQNIIWSSWYHAQRELKLHVIIQHNNLTNAIVQTAFDHNWFMAATNTNKNINN